MKYKIACLPGDGIGKDVMDASMLILKSMSFDVEFIWGEVGWTCWEKYGNALPEHTVQLLKGTDACLFGAITSKPGVKGYRSPIVLFPFRVQDITVVSHDCKDVVVTDNFAIMHIWNQSEDPLLVDETRELVFTCNPLTGISGGEELPFLNCHLINSPNPFSNSTVISFNLPEQMPVTLSIFDISGRLVETLADGSFPAGTSSVTWEGSIASQIPDGIYICQLRAGSRSFTSRMVRLR